MKSCGRGFGEGRSAVSHAGADKSGGVVCVHFGWKCRMFPFPTFSCSTHGMMRVNQLSHQYFWGFGPVSVSVHKDRLSSPGGKEPI